MENSNEKGLMVDPWKGEKEFFAQKTDDNSMKHDKCNFYEFPNSCSSKVLDSHKGTEVLSKTNLEKQKIRQFLSNRADMMNAMEAKSPKPKKRLDSPMMGNSKVPCLPLLSIRTNALEELYKEMKDLKMNINELDEKNKVNSQCIEINTVRIHDMEERLGRLKQKAGLGLSHDEKREELSCKLIALQSSWKKSTLKLKKSIQELEDDSRLLLERAEYMKSQLLRKGQQQNQLKKSLNQSSSHSEGIYRSCELLNSSGQLKSMIHTPSLNSLYR